MKTFFYFAQKKFLGALIIVGSILWMFSFRAIAADEPLSKKEAQKQVMLNEIVVTGTRTPHSLKGVPVETAVITRKDIQRSNAQNIMGVLKMVPGISVDCHDDIFGTYTWRAKMRGLSFNDGYGLILIDGQRVLGAGQSGGMGEYGVGLNQVPLEMVERIEIVKGPGSALYGSDAMAGVVNIITRRSPDKPSGWAGASYGWYDVKEKENSDGSVTKPSDYGHDRNTSRAYISFGDRPVERFGYLLSYNYESAEDVRQDPIESDRHFFMGKMDLDVADSLNLFIKGEVSDYEKDDQREEDSYRIAPGLEWRPASNHFLSVKGYLYKWDFDHGYPGYPYGHKYGDIGYDQTEVQYTWNISEQNVLTFGGEFLRQSIDYEIDNPDGSHIEVSEDVDTYSLYAQDEIKPFEDLTIVAGVRFDDHSEFGDEINPKLSMMYQLFPNTTFRASVGRAFKSPTIRQMYYDAPYKHSDYYIQSNSDLKPEISIGYSASVEHWLWQDRIMINIGYFRNEVDDMVVREDTGEIYDGLPLLTYENIEEATIQGAELSAKVDYQDFSLSLSYTYTDSENDETGKELTYIPEHSLTLAPSYEWPQYGFGVSGVITYAGRQYKDTVNTSEINEHTVVDARVYKYLNEKAKVTFLADNIFDSDKGDDGNFRTGRTLMVKFDLTF